MDDVEGAAFELEHEPCAARERSTSHILHQSLASYSIASVHSLFNVMPSPVPTAQVTVNCTSERCQQELALRRWLTKLAVAVDLPFLNAIGGARENPSHDLNEGDIIWLVPQVFEQYQLEAIHWEVLSLEESSEKLINAETIKRHEFEEALRNRLHPLVEGRN